MKKFRRAAALIAIVLLVSLYLICLIAAISGSEKAQTIFRFTLGMTVALPVLLYGLVLLFKLVKNREERAAQIVQDSLEEAQEKDKEKTENPEE